MRYNPVELYHEFLNQMQSASFHDSVVDIEKHDDNDSTYYRLDCSCELSGCCSSRKEAHLDECRCARCTRMAHTPTPQRPGNGSEGGASPKCHALCVLQAGLGPGARLSEGLLHPWELPYEVEDDIDLDDEDDASDDDNDDDDNDNDDASCYEGVGADMASSEQNPVVPGLFPKMDLASKTQFAPYSVLPLNPSYVE